MALNRLGLASGQPTSMVGDGTDRSRFSGLPFSFSSGRGVSLGLGSTAFALPNAMLSDTPLSLSLLGHFGQIFPQQEGKDQPNAHSPSQKDSQRGLLAKPTRSNDGNSGKSSSAYASRHQAAEQRRRTRINERLDLLRQMVPHSDRANTASFLEEVLKYIDSLKTRVSELESCLLSLQPNDKAPAVAAIKGQKGNLTVGQDFPSAQPSIPVPLPPGQGQGHLNVDYCLQQLKEQQLQQQHLQQLLQQQHDAAVMALHEEQQQKAAALAQQLRQQQELAAARQAMQLADLATHLGLKTVPAVFDSATLDGLKLPAKNSQQDAHAGLGLSPAETASLQPVPETSHSLPGIRQLQPVAFPATTKSDGAATTTAALKNGAGPSPVSSEESGVPLKKRKMLLL